MEAKEENKCVCEERVRAYMRMLRVGEGTGELVKSYDKKQKKVVYIKKDPQKGYTMAFGGNTITDLSKHPETVWENSSASGAYQIMRYTWWWLNGEKLTKDLKKVGVYEKSHDYIKKYKIPDFKQLSQDKLCIIIMKHTQSGLIEQIIKGNIEIATREKGSGIWASLPHVGDNSRYKYKGKLQPATPMKHVLEHYEQFYQEELKGISNLHLKKGFLKEFGFTCQCGGQTKTENKNTGKWHDPVDNPQRTKYNSYGYVKPENGAYGNVRNGGKKYHSGLDLFALPDVTPIYAPLSCTIAGITEGPVGGKVVRIKIDNTKELLEQEKRINYQLEYKYEEKGIDIKETDTVYFIYMHLSAIPSKKLFTIKDVGKKIKAGEIIGYTGVTGNADGIPSPHLHLEVATVLDPFNNGGKSKRTNPARFIKLNSYDTKEQDDASKKNHNIKYK